VSGRVGPRLHHERRRCVPKSSTPHLNPPPQGGRKLMRCARRRLTLARRNKTGDSRALQTTDQYQRFTSPGRASRRAKPQAGSDVRARRDRRPRITKCHLETSDAGLYCDLPIIFGTFRFQRQHGESTSTSRSITLRGCLPRGGEGWVRRVRLRRPARVGTPLTVTFLASARSSPPGSRRRPPELAAPPLWDTLRDDRRPWS
jgi:hypothetical protein